MKALSHLFLKNHHSFFLFLAIVFFAHKVLIAQDLPILISGQVVDSINLNPLENVHISSPESQIGVVSSANGKFELIITDLPVTLWFSRLSYQEKQIRIERITDTNLVVKLSPKSYNLDEVTIMDKNIYNKNIHRFSVLDYGFKGDSILVLQTKRSRGGIPSLVVLNQQYDTINYLAQLPKGIYKIFRDCLNTFHLVSKDSVYQIDFEGGKLSLYQPYESKWFYQIMGDCIFKKEGKIFFEFPIYQGFGHEIVYINEETKKKNLFVRYVDKEQFERITDEISEISSYYYLHNVVNASTNDSATVHHIHFYDYQSRFLKDINDLPIKNTICLNKDTIHYFNYYESKIQSFHQLDQPPKETPIDYQEGSGWGSELMIDNVNNQIYSIVKDKSDFVVYHLNINKGVPEYVSKLSIFEGNNIKVNNGYLYFLKNYSTTVYHVRKLSRIKL